MSAAMPRKEVITLTPEYVFILDTAYFSRLHSWSRLSNFIALDLGKEQILYTIITNIILIVITSFHTI
jgi:hypothetical protein